MLPSWPSELTGVISMALRLESLETPDLEHNLGKKITKIIKVFIAIFDFDNIAENSWIL